jgi:hypothetical protein
MVERIVHRIESRLSSMEVPDYGNHPFRLRPLDEIPESHLLELGNCILALAGELRRQRERQHVA